MLGWVCKRNDAKLMVTKNFYKYNVDKFFYKCYNTQAS